MLRNCPISRADIVAAEDIFRPNLGSLKGKTVRKKSMDVPSLVADVPFEIIKTHRDVTVCFDIMFVYKIAFVITVSRNIRFGTTERILSRNADVVSQALLRVIAFYRQRGFRGKECYGDGEFEPLRSGLADARAQLNITSEDEHVPDIERYILTVKERTRVVQNTLPYEKMPGLMIVEMVHASNYRLNMFPSNDGVSAVQSPRRIMTGQYGDYDLHCQLQFGEYVQAHESHGNSMMSRTTGAIALRLTGNIQGGYYFMSLTTGKRLNRSAWTPLPMPGEVIDRVHMLARRNPAGSDIQFGWRDGTPVEDTLDDEDDLHDEDYVSGTDDSDNDDDGSYDPEPHPVGGVGDYDNNDQELVPDDDDDDSSDEDFVPADNDDDDSSDEDFVPADNAANESEEDDTEETGSVANDTGNDDDDADDGDVDDTPERVASRDSGADSTPTGVAPGVRTAPATGVASGVRPPLGMDKKYGSRRRSGLRATKAPRSADIKTPQSAAHHALCLMLEHELIGLEGLSVLEHTSLAQFNLKRGMEMFGQAAIDAVSKEMKQLHDRKTIAPRHSKYLTLEDKRKALGYVPQGKEMRHNQRARMR
jgi:hypothetical protein